MKELNIDAANAILKGWDFNIQHRPDGKLVLHYSDESMFGPEAMPLDVLLQAIDALRGGRHSEDNQ